MLLLFADQSHHVHIKDKISCVRSFVWFYGKVSQ